MPAPALPLLPALALRCAAGPTGAQLLHGVRSKKEESLFLGSQRWMKAFNETGASAGPAPVQGSEPLAT